MKSYRPIKPETVLDGAKDVSFSQKLWEKKHPSHRPTPFFFETVESSLRRNSVQTLFSVRIKWLLGSHVICRTTVTKFTGWVTEMFTLQLNVYTVAISLQQLIVMIEWLRLNIRGFLMVAAAAAASLALVAARRQRRHQRGWERGPS